jgi:lipopolysaccharide export system protein LptC
MTLSNTQLMIFALLIALLIAITMTWLRPSKVIAPTPLSADVAEWFAVEATSTTIADNGQAKHEVSAQRLTYYDQLQQTAFIKPKALVFNPELPAWQLVANQGVSYHESALEEMREIDLMGNVIIWREATKDLPRSEMQTEFLKFFPEKDYVETDQQVTFTYGQHEMSGLGMWADLDTQQVKLLKNVKGKYIHE